MFVTFDGMKVIAAKLVDNSSHSDTSTYYETHQKSELLEMEAFEQDNRAVLTIDDKKFL